MKTICAWIGASLLALAIGVLTVATASEVRVARASGRRMRRDPGGVSLQAAANPRPAREASSRPR